MIASSSALAMCLGALATPALGQQAPAASSAPTKATVAHQTVHHHKGHHRHVSMAKPTEEPQTAAPVQRPDYTEAPTPNGNLLPPTEYVPPNAAVIPGTMQLHYPPSGEGYVPGSSPQAMDDARTAKVPGVTLHLPIQPEAPPPLPSPTDPSH